MVVEVIGGLMSGSLALLADAGHMLTDSVALLLALVAARLAQKPADRLRSYGYQRVQILAAFLNGSLFILLVIWIGVEAVQRILQPSPVLGGPMLVVAVLGMIVNLLAFRLLHGGQSGNLNLRAASLHVLGDLLGSVAAVSAALVIMLTGWMPIDPILSIVVAMLILRSAWGVVRESGHILLEGTPPEIDVRVIRQALIDEVKGVRDIHHVHIWSLAPEHTMLTLHADITDDADAAQILREVKAVLAQRFNLRHTTIQVEPGGCADEEIVRRE